MKSGTIITTSFITSFILSIVGAYLKIRHFENANIWLALAIISSLFFIVTAIFEVRNSNRIGRTEKTIWTLAFIFFVNIAGLIYLLIGRKRVVVNQ